MNLWSDIRFSVRQLRKSPGFTTTVLITLGLCIGANTAIYSVIDAVLVRPLPYPEADRLGSLALHVHSPKGDDVRFNMNGVMWEAAYRGATKLDVAADGGVSGVNLAANRRVEYVQQQRVSAGYFHVLGVAPLLGREFNSVEDTAGGPAAAVLSHELWQRVFNRDATIVGRQIELRGEPFTVVGVMPKNFVNSQKVDLWAPLRPSTSGEGGGLNYGILTRLKPGVMWNQASAELKAIEQPILKTQLAQWHTTQNVTADMQLVPLQRALTDEIRSAMLPKWGAVVLILLIGCVNIAGILLARSASRRQEIATRMAIGAGRRRVITQLLTESLLLALGGGAIGVLFAATALDVLRRLGMEGFDLWRPVALDTRVLLITLFISLSTGVVFGLLPALEASRVDLRSVLVEGGRGTPGRGHRRTRQVLVVGEIALGVVLLASAGLLIRTLANLEMIEPGFDPHHVLVGQLSLQDARYTTSAKVNALFGKSLERFRALPAVESAAVGLSLPYQRPLNVGVRVLDGPDKIPDYSITDMIFVTPGYFETLRMQVKAGRTFEDRDDASGQPVAVVNQAFVKRYLRHQSSLDTHLDFGEGKPATIMGLVVDTPQHSGAGDFGPLSSTPTVYMPFAQAGDKSLAMIFTYLSPNWIVRTRGADGRLRGEMQAAIQAIDPKIPFAAFKSMNELQSSSIGRQRYEAVLFSTFAGLALLLAAVGIYGLVATSVTQRTREIGIRLALGATARHAALSIVNPGLRLTAIGIALGLVLTWFASTLLHSLVWGVQPHDALTYLTVTALMSVVAVLANLFPALRLLKLDLARTLRQD